MPVLTNKKYSLRNRPRNEAASCFKKPLKSLHLLQCRQETIEYGLKEIVSTFKY
jgi:hypothetical protein